ncbi:30125_t:CDS:2, partial [Gigaspora margarita]
ESCIQAANKNNETNSSVINKILDEVGSENHVPEETQKNKYLEWIISLQNWAFVDKYPVELWKEKAENTF